MFAPLVALLPATAHAQDAAPPPPAPDFGSPATPASSSPPPSPELAPLEVKGRRPEVGPKGRAAQTVTRAELDEKQARSVPDALRSVPGVTIQQTSHGQASPFIRGLTGQRVLMLFDGFRLNHALFRQGPNQYLFTVDANSIERLRVVRGAASVLLGTDALGGAVMMTPREPRLESERTGLTVHPRAEVRHATQDHERGGRVEADVQLGERTGFLGGVGYRKADELEAGGPIAGPEGAEPQSPCFDVNGVTTCTDREGTPPTTTGARRIQHGTGFREFAADARLVHQLEAGQRLTAAAYVYREYDAPRTDRCPPPEATSEECMIYEEQYRTHVYGKAQLAPGLPGAARLTAGLGYQRYHERRRLDRPLSFTTLGGRDDVDMVDAYVHAETATRALGERARLKADYGLTGTREAVESKAWTIFTSSTTDAERVFPQDRGVYVDGSRFLQGGAWAEPTLTLYETLTLRGGARVAFAHAQAAGDPQTETTGVDARWTMRVANAGLEWRALEPLTLFLMAEQGVRPPNLDDLTARQATGRGYQLENPDLAPERSFSLETGARFDHGPALLELWVYQVDIDDAMERRRAECPASNFECGSNRAPLQLVNTAGTAVIRGFEAMARFDLPAGVALSAGVAWAEGETDNPLKGLAAQDADKKRVPLSRIAPLNGTADLVWHGPDDGLYLGGTLYWSARQTELSYADTNDARIPKGGTPGFERVDLRAGLRFPDRLSVSLLFENVLDEAYRIHGSGVNGPGRGLILNVEVMR